MIEANKVNVIVTRDCPLILDSTTSPNKFGVMEIEKGAYVEISASMNITIDVLKRPEEEVVSEIKSIKNENILQNPEYDFYIKGKNGKKGEDGDWGQNGQATGCHGLPGMPGEPGAVGGDGPLLTITIGELQDNFSLINIGGTGGRGGSGGNGGRGADNESGTGGNGGTGGDGGNGGNGGAGAKLTLYYPTDSGYHIACNIKAASGGLGGSQGKGGLGGSGKTVGNPGENGKNGVSGMMGNMGETKVNPSSSKLDSLFQRLGGKNKLQEKYPAVYEGILKAQAKMSESNALNGSMNNIFRVDSPGLYKKTVANENLLGAGMEEKYYLVSDATGKFPKGMEYVYMSGTLESAAGTVEASFAEEYEADDENMVCDTEASMDVYMLDILRMNDMAYRSKGECYAVDEDGAVHSFDGGRNQEIIVEGGNSIVEKLKVTAPIHTNKENSDNIIVLYAREPRDNETNTWDYKFPENAAKDNKVQTKLNYSGTITVKDGHEIKGFSYAGFGLELYYQGLDEPTATYNYEQSIVGTYFELSEDKKTCTFNYGKGDADWNCKLDLSAYDVSCIQKLKSYFYITVYNKKTKQDNMITIVINSTEDKTKQCFETEGTTIYIPPISIRWGCFHKNTRIKMADGSEKEIKDIQIGEMVLTADEKAIKVQNVYTGHEHELICIQTENGREIQVTESHPIGTENGLVRAKDIHIGDVVVMPWEENSKVKFIFKCPYDDIVYNLELEEPKELIANGIVAGDFIVQNTMPASKRKSQRTEEAEETIKQLKSLLREVGSL